jgi:hypothetical protein
MLRALIKFILLVIILTLVVGSVYLYLDRDHFANAPQLIVHEQPLIGEPSAQPLTYQAGPNADARTFILVPTASYTIFGRVLSLRRYSTLDYDGDLAPYDLALGWGQMSNRDVLKHIRFQHIGIDRVRYLSWSWRDSRSQKDPALAPFPLDQRLFSNTQIIPASPEIQQKINSLATGDFVRLRGQLVDARLPADPNWQPWKSSLSLDDRNDRWGDKEFSKDELMYVVAVEIMR